MVDIYLAASRLSKYPPLATDTEANSCSGMYLNSEIISLNSSIHAKITTFSGANSAQIARR